MKAFITSDKAPFIKIREICPPFNVDKDGTVDLEWGKAYLNFLQAKEALLVRLLEKRTSVQHSINSVRKLTERKVESTDE